MQKGTRWIYRGQVESGEGAGELKVQLDWKMEIVDSLQRGPYKAALIIGHPKDLTFYAAGRQRGCYVLIAVNDKKFYMNECGPRASREKLTLTEGDITKITDQEDMIFKLPLRRGESFGGDPDRGVNDGMYAWSVLSVKRGTTEKIRWISSAGPWTEYVLTYRTNPDDERDTYVPCVGLTEFQYSHHGTLSEVDVKLVEFHSPGP